MVEKRVGKVEHYYPKAQAAAVKLSGKVKLGDKIHIVGHGDDVTEDVTSLQLDHVPIQEGKPGQSIGVWVPEKVHEGDDVMLVGGASAGKKASSKAKPKKAAKKSKAKPKKASKAKPGKKGKSKGSKAKKKGKKGKGKR